MEKIQCLNLEKFYLINKTQDDEEGEPKGIIKYPCVSEVIGIIKRPEVKKEGNTYHEASIALETNDCFIALKDTPETIAYLSQFFDLPPVFDAAV